MGKPSCDETTYGPGAATSGVALRLHLAETMQLTKEALEMTEQLKDTDGQATCLSLLALLFPRDNKFNKAEETTFRSITLLRESSNKLSFRP